MLSGTHSIYKILLPIIEIILKDTLLSCSKGIILLETDQRREINPKSELAHILLTLSSNYTF